LASFLSVKANGLSMRKRPQLGSFKKREPRQDYRGFFQP